MKLFTIQWRRIHRRKRDITVIPWKVKPRKLLRPAAQKFIKCAAEEGVYCSLFDIRSMIICFMNFCRVSFDKSPSLVAVDSAMCVGM